jgi:putative tryptophan/tyrosine transport system ATP-binding protein
VLWKMGQQKKFFMMGGNEQREFFEQHVALFNPRLVLKLDTEVSLLSGGERQALVLSLIFLRPPKMLLLDEHTSALDPKTSSAIMELTADLVAKHNMGCIMITHDLHMAEKFGNRVIALKEGQVVLDSYSKPSIQEMMHCCYGI